MFDAEKLLSCRPLKKISWLLMACFALFDPAGCATKDNNYTQCYQDKAGADLAYLPAFSGKTRILTTTNIVNDVKDLYRSGYTLLGDSEFQGPSLPDRALRFQAHQVGADVVVRSREFVRMTTTATPWPSSLDTRGRLIAPDIQAGSRLYQYQAGFFRQGHPDILGVWDRPTTPEVRQKMRQDQGVLVYVVRNGSPAFKADITEGDVIMGMGGEAVKSDADMREKLNKFAGQKVDLEIWRDGQLKTNSVQLNKQP
jgi:hypothetical protein